MDINELVLMFNQNNIPVNAKDLIHLLFKKNENKRQRHKVLFLKEDEYSLDFNKLVKFATSTEDQDKFIDFMRKIRKRIGEKRNDLTRKTVESIDIENTNSVEELKKTYSSNFIETELTKSFNRNHFIQNSSKLKVIEEEKNHKEEEVIYLPMSINKVLQHFNSKGKIRGNLNNIKNTIVRRKY